MTSISSGTVGTPRPGPLAGIRILEVAQWVFVPGAGGILADWGADVIKVEHSTAGDALRGLYPDKESIKYRHIIHNTNRGKRSIGIDLKKPEGRALLLRMVETSDVFLTNFLPDARRKLGIDVGDIQAVNPSIVYARGSGMGPRGPESAAGGYDFSHYWARSGVASVYHHPTLDYPMAGNAMFGDLLSATVLAGGISAALVERERTGRGPVVDVSLLGVGVWSIAGDIITSAEGEPYAPLPKLARDELRNPLTNVFRTSDLRFLAIVLLQSDRDWPEFSERLDAPQLREDPRFADSAGRLANAKALVAELDSVFGKRSLAEWKERLHGADFVWDVFQNPAEVAEDPQVLANDYVVRVADAEGSTAPDRLVASPVQFDERSMVPRRAPEHAEHSELILLDLGLEWDEIAQLKDQDVVS